MILLTFMIGYMIFMKNLQNQFTPSLLIGISALTASVAMSRTVYSTKVSDEAKLNRELSSMRLELFSELATILRLFNNPDRLSTNAEDLHKLATKAKYLFEDESINDFLLALIITAKARFEIVLSESRRNDPQAWIPSPTEIAEILNQVERAKRRVTDLFNSHLNLM